LAQRFPVDVRHDVVERSVDFTAVEYSYDPGVIELSYCSDFSEEAVSSERMRDFPPENLDRDVPAVFPVVRSQHGAHSAATDFRFHHVAIR
jgi:hypothetical protein